MANVAFKKGLLSALPSTHAEGTFYVTTDERAIYLDVSDSARIRLGDFQEFATLADLEANTNPSTSALYYISELNILAKWDGDKYVQINRDTGMTSVEVTGEGNAVTAAVYDESGRKLTLTKGATYMTADDVDGKIAAAVGELGNDEDGNAYADVKAYVDAKTEGIATNAALSELQGAVTQAEADIDALEKDTHTHDNKTVLDGITEAKVAAWDAAEQNAKDYADGLASDYDAAGSAAAVDEKLTAEVARAQAAEAVNAAAAKAADDKAVAAQEAADAKVASVAAGDVSVTVAGTATAPTVAAKLSQDADNALELAEDGLKVVIPAAAEYTIEKAAESGDYAAVYALKKDGVQVGASINIPKDMVVESGSVVENPDGQAEGTYIKLVLQNVEEPLYINVGSLIEYVTSGSQTGDMVVIAVSDDHKVTASITDGSITLAKLATDVQTAIGKAHSHENASVLAGITEQKVADWDDAVAKEHEHANKDVIDGITADKVAAWDGAQAAAEATAAAALGEAKTELEGKISAAQVAAEKVANDNNSAMDTRVKALEAIDHDAYIAADETNLQAAKNYADGLADNYDEAGAAAQALTDAKAYADGLVLTWGSF